MISIPISINVALGIFFMCYLAFTNPLKGFLPEKSTGCIPIPAVVAQPCCVGFLRGNKRSLAEIWEKLTPMARIGIILSR